MKAVAYCMDFNLRFLTMLNVACSCFTFSTQACCDNLVTDQERGKIPGRGGNLVKRTCNSRTCSHAQKSLHSIYMAVAMNACSCAGAHTQTHDCTQQAFDRQQHAGGGQVQPLSNPQWHLHDTQVDVNPNNHTFFFYR